jgi:hypothetical protein
VRHKRASLLRCHRIAEFFSGLFRYIFGGGHISPLQNSAKEISPISGNFIKRSLNQVWS